MKFWNRGPTTICHYCMSLILKVKKSLHPNIQQYPLPQTILVVLVEVIKLVTTILRYVHCTVPQTILVVLVEVIKLVTTMLRYSVQYHRPS